LVDQATRSSRLLGATADDVQPERGIGNPPAEATEYREAVPAFEIGRKRDSSTLRFEPEEAA
jgi:hypothetical protein